MRSIDSGHPSFCWGEVMSIEVMFMIGDEVCTGCFDMILICEIGLSDAEDRVPMNFITGNKAGFAESGNSPTASPYSLCGIFSRIEVS